MIKEISYGIIPVRDGNFLLLRVYDNWDFPKGKPEDGESPVDTARRELFEESGLYSPEFSWGDEYVETAPYKKGKKIARYFIASCQTGDVALLPNPETGLTEHHEYMWVKPDDANKLIKERLLPVLAWARLKTGL